MKSKFILLVASLVAFNSMYCESLNTQSRIVADARSNHNTSTTPSAPERHLIRVFITQGNPKTDAGRMYSYNCADPEQLEKFHTLVETILSNFEKFCGQWFEDKDLIREQILRAIEYACLYEDVFISVQHNKENCVLEMNYAEHSQTIIDLHKKDYLPKNNQGLLHNAQTKIRSVLAALLG